MGPGSGSAEPDELGFSDVDDLRAEMRAEDRSRELYRVAAVCPRLGVARVLRALRVRRGGRR